MANITFASAQTEISVVECSECHGDLTFDASSVNRSETCGAKCHGNDVFPKAHPISKYVITDYGWFKSVSSSNVTAPYVHDNVHMDNDEIFESCASYGCHATSTCSKCHDSDDVFHVTHGSNNIGASYSCGSELCHNLTMNPLSSSINMWSIDQPKPACENCHNDVVVVSRHNITEIHQSTLTLECQTCHSNNLPDTHATIANESYNGDSCAICHQSTNTTVMSAITNNDTNCAACHTFHGNITETHTFDQPSSLKCPNCHQGTYLPDLHNNFSIENNISTNCSVCHSNTNINISIASANCMTCHDSQLDAPHDSNGTSCVSCHGIISSSDLALNLGLHSSLNGTLDVDDGDCKTCHFESSHSGVSPANTYYCADCHTYAGTGPNKSTITFIDKLHGENTCTDCHVADGTYHQNDPRGSVVNLTYVNRDVTGSTTVTDCADCHDASNLDDAPFNAPAGGSHIFNYGGACSGSCHTSGIPTMIQTVHNVGVGPRWGDRKPSITVPILDVAAVSPGTGVTVTANVTTVGMFHYVDGAQYRIMEGATEVLPWTPMVAVDGDFEGAGEDVTITFNTSLLPFGTYTVEVRGMAGGPAHNSTERYYPMNGDVSSTESVTLIVQQPPGYINGTVRSGGFNLSGVLVSTTGAMDTTGSDGAYSLMVPAGTYNVTASKLPEYNDSTIAVGVVVVEAGETIRDFDLVIKLTGSISGNVVNHI